METNVNKEQVCELDERAVVNAFEVEELEKRYEMGWIKSTDINVGVKSNLNGELTVEGGANFHL